MLNGRFWRNAALGISPAEMTDLGDLPMLWRARLRQTACLTKWPVSTSISA